MRNALCLSHLFSGSKNPWQPLLVFLFLSAAAEVHASPVSDRPVLRIETGDHTGIILGLAPSPSGAMLATTSYDGTVRLWALPRLDLLNTIRIPVGSGVEGAVTSVAFSPDGKTIATSGQTSTQDVENGPWCFYVIDVRSADIRRSVCDLPQVARNMAFSPDGRFLVLVLRRGAGMRVYRTSDYTLTHEDTSYGDSSNWVDFSVSGRMATSSLDGKVRLYDENFQLIASSAMPEGRKPLTVSFSPDGSRIAVAYAEPEGDDPLWRPAVDVFSAADLSRLFRPDVSGMNNGTLWRLAWSADGKFLYAGGTWKIGERYFIRRWADGGRGKPTDIAAATSRIRRIRSLPLGGIVFAAEVPYIGIIGPTSDRVTSERKVSIADYSEIGDRFGISRDGLAIQFAFEASGKQLAHFSFSKRLLQSGEAPADEELTGPAKDNADLDVRDWVWSYRPTLNGQPLPMKPHNYSLAMTTAARSKSIILATSWEIIRYDAKGNVVWSTPIHFNARGVVVTADERLVVAAISDGTIRWYAFDSGKELLAFFPHKDGRRWVAWTPSGYYMSSVGGDRLIGWQVNRGREKAANFFSVSRFRNIYYRPDIVMRVLAVLDEGTAIRFANAETGRTDNQSDLATLLPPVVSILSPTSGDAVRSGKVAIDYEVIASTDERIDTIEFRADGRPIAVMERGAGGSPIELRGRIEVYVPRHDAIIELLAKTENGIWSEPDAIQLRWDGPVSDEKTALYVLAVGVSKYRTESLRLNFADIDAQGLVAVLKLQEGRAYRSVHVLSLENEKATVTALGKALDWLASAPTGRDTAVLFLAGHGIDDAAGRYYFIPQDVAPEDVFKHGLSYQDIRASLARVAGRAFLFIDTCYSGAITNAAVSLPDMIRIVNDLRSSEHGVTVFASSTGRQVSLERSDWGHGAFTKALLDGMAGDADPRKTGYVTTSGLSSYLSDAVPKLTEGRQTPIIGIPPSVDFKLLELR